MLLSHSSLESLGSGALNRPGVYPTVEQRSTGTRFHNLANRRNRCTILPFYDLKTDFWLRGLRSKNRTAIMVSRADFAWHNEFDLIQRVGDIGQRDPQFG